MRLIAVVQSFSEQAETTIYGLFINPTLDVTDRLQLTGIGLFAANGGGGTSHVLGGKMIYRATDNLRLFVDAKYMSADAEGVAEISSDTYWSIDSDRVITYSYNTTIPSDYYDIVGPTQKQPRLT